MSLFLLRKFFHDISQESYLPHGVQGVVPLDERPDMALQPEESSANLAMAAGPKAG